MSNQLTDDQRKDLYGSLLRGIGKQCQDMLCVRDQRHDWGPMIWREIPPDPPMIVMTQSQSAAAMNVQIRRVGLRVCENCGKCEDLVG